MWLDQRDWYTTSEDTKRDASTGRIWADHVISELSVALDFKAFNEEAQLPGLNVM